MYIIKKKKKHAKQLSENPFHSSFFFLKAILVPFKPILKPSLLKRMVKNYKKIK